MRSRTMDHLFSGEELLQVLASDRARIAQEIDKLEDAYIEKVNDEELCAYFKEKYARECPKLIKESIEQLEPETVQVDVSRDPMRIISDRSRPAYVAGQRITVVIPFSGDGNLFQYQTRTYTMNPPIGAVIGQDVHLIFEGANLNAETLKRDVEATVKSIEEQLRWVWNDVSQQPNQIDQVVKQRLAYRRDLLKKRQSVSSGLGIPIRKRENPPPQNPTVRRKIQPPQAASTPDDPVLSMEIYEHILKVCSDMAKVMELSPSAFSTLKEEELRSHFLVSLNAHYEGQATGETFNFGGKTDIIIKWAGGNAFIAECKFWAGEKEFAKAIDQLLGYVTWRDTKTAIIVFNTNKNFTSVLENMHKTASAHPNFVRELGKPIGDTSRRYVFSNANDSKREFLLTTLAFDIPA